MQDMENQEIMRNTDEGTSSTFVDSVKAYKKQMSEKDAQIAKLQADYSQLQTEVMNGLIGEVTPQETNSELKSRVEYLNEFDAKKLSKMSSLEGVETLINLRKATIAETGKDPCVTGQFGQAPEGVAVEPSYGEAEEIARNFDVLEDMVKEANGDSALFRQFVTAGLRK